MDKQPHMYVTDMTATVTVERRVALYTDMIREVFGIMGITVDPNSEVRLLGVDLSGSNGKDATITFVVQPSSDVESEEDMG